VTNAAPQQAVAIRRASLAGEPAQLSASEQLVELNRAAGDTLRQNILQLLARESFAVLELTRVLDVSQSALSHHLKLLLSAGLIDDLPLDAQQQRAIAAIHTERKRRSQAFFSANARQLAEQSTLISNPETYAEAADELLKQARCGSAKALEVGPGEGQLLSLLAARFSDVLGIDSAQAMLDQAADSAGTANNIRLQLRDFADLPARRVFDAVAAAMVLHHQPSPIRFFQQAHRVLKPGGVLMLVDLCRHDQEWVRKTCGDFWLGFEPDELIHWGKRTGFAPPASQYLAQNNGFQVQLHAFAKLA